MYKSPKVKDPSDYYSNGVYDRFPLSFKRDINISKTGLVEMTTNVIDLSIDDIDETKRAEINSFLDETYTECGGESSNLYIPVDMSSSCNYYFLFMFVQAKKNFGYSELEIKEKYGVHNILIDAYEKDIKNLNNIDLISTDVRTLNPWKLPTFLMAVNEFDNTPLLTDDEKKQLIVTMVDTMAPSVPSWNYKYHAFLVLAIKSSGLNYSEVNKLPKINSTRLLEFCSYVDIKKIDEIKDYNIGVEPHACVAAFLTTVKNFCGIELTEKEKGSINNFLSTDYIKDEPNLGNEICKRYITVWNKEYIQN